MKRLALIVLLTVTMPGCATTGGAGNARWYNPTTWFSGSEGRAAAKTEAKIDVATAAALNAAKTSAHETQEALLTVPASRSTSVAIQSNDNAVALLDQVTGPLTAKDMAAIHEKVRLLVSELADERARGEAMRLSDQKKDDKLSDLLVRLNDAKAEDAKHLADAFVRENGLANELRNERWWSWFWRIALGTTAILATAGYIYLRLTLGGLPTALGQTLGKFRAADPAAAEVFTQLLDIPTTPAEQAMIRMLVAKHN